MTVDPAVDPSDDATPARLTYIIGRLDRAVRTRLSERLGEHGLTVAQFTTLSVLAGRPGLTNAQLARRALIAPQSMIQVLSNLESRGLVARTPARGRTLETELTPSGHALLVRGDVASRAIEAEMLGDAFDPEELRIAGRAMARWTARLTQAG